jgi:hypothetical protein
MPGQKNSIPRVAGTVTRTLAILAAVLLLACAHRPTPAHRALIQRGDCAGLLRAADAARAASEHDLAAELAGACAPERLSALVDSAAPAQALLWCGRAAAAQQKGCDPKQIAQLAARLHPRLTIGPPDETMPLDAQLGAALDQLGGELNLSWSARDPDVIIGKLTISFEHVTTNTSTTVQDSKGGQQRIPAVQHRFVARAEAQVGVSGKMRVLRAVEEARDLTWDATQKTVAAKFDPQVPPADELKKRAAIAWLRVLAKTLAASPPEAVDVTDDKGCVAYGLSLNLTSGDPGAAANGLGDPAKVATCEKLLGAPAGAGIPVP